MTRFPAAVTAGMVTLFAAGAEESGGLGTARWSLRQASPQRAATGITLRIACTEAALRAAFDGVAAAGAGTITFDCANATIGMRLENNIVFRGNNMVLDGGAQGWFLLFEGNSMSEASFGVRVYGDAQATIQGNTFGRGTRTGRVLGVYVFNRGRALLAGNTMAGYDNGPDSHAVLIQDAAQVDLGGGRVEIDGAIVSSPGRNTFRNGLRGAPHDVRNDSANLVMAERNWWDHSTVAEVQQHDVLGLVDVDPPNAELRP